MMSHLYFSWYKLFNYKYLHIVKPNLLYLNKCFFSYLHVKFDILCFSESWLIDATKQLHGHFSRISIISLSQAYINKRGGGINIFIKDSI